MKIKSLVVALTLAFVFIVAGISNAQNAPGISVSLNKKSYTAGGNGIITIKFKCPTGIKIAVEPEIVVSLSGDGVTGTGLQGYGGGDYLSPAQVKYDFTVNSGASVGSYSIKVSVKFAYCNMETGVCKITTKTANVTVKVK
jgi:ABC-type Fe3+-hydroxamate transport system substrate-binding protein